MSPAQVAKSAELWQSNFLLSNTTVMKKQFLANPVFSYESIYFLQFLIFLRDPGAQCGEIMERGKLC